MWNYQEMQHQQPWGMMPQMPANFAVFPAAANVPQTPLGMGTGAQAMLPMTVPATPQMPLVGTQPAFDPWSAAAANAKTQTVSHKTLYLKQKTFDPFQHCFDPRKNEHMFWIPKTCL